MQSRLAFLEHVHVFVCGHSDKHRGAVCSSCDISGAHTLLTVLSSYPGVWKPRKGSSTDTTLTDIMPVPTPSYQYFLFTCIYQMQLSHQIKLWVCLSHLHVTLGRKKRGKKKSNENDSICNSPIRTETSFLQTSVKR